MELRVVTWQHCSIPSIYTFDNSRLKSSLCDYVWIMKLVVAFTSDIGSFSCSRTLSIDMLSLEVISIYHWFRIYLWNIAHRRFNVKLTKLFNIYVEYFKAAMWCWDVFFVCFSSSSNILRSSRSCVWAKVECFVKSQWSTWRRSLRYGRFFYHIIPYNRTIMSFINFIHYFNL